MYYCEVRYMAKSPKQQKAADDYLKNKVDTIIFRVPKGEKALLFSYANAQGKSLNAFIYAAIHEKIERDKETPPANND
jgi:predicted HicB family RNase H-like nuclease